MLASKNSIERRIAALTATVRPADSLDGRIARLLPDERAQYLEWRERYDRWATRHAGENLYAAMIDGYGPPKIPSSLIAKIYPKHCPPLDGDSLNIISEKYGYLRERKR